MIYKLLVNVAFLAAGYYIGREVGRLSCAQYESDQRQATGSNESDTKSTSFEEDNAS